MKRWNKVHKKDDCGSTSHRLRGKKIINKKKSFVLGLLFCVCVRLFSHTKQRQRSVWSNVFLKTYSQREWSIWGDWIIILRQIQNIWLKAAGACPHRLRDWFTVGNIFGFFTSDKCSLYSILTTYCMSPCLVHTEEECTCSWVFSTCILWFPLLQVIHCWHTAPVYHVLWI